MKQIAMCIAGLAFKKKFYANRDLIEAEAARVRNLVEGLPKDETDAIGQMMFEGRARGVAFTPEQAVSLGVFKRGYLAYRGFITNYRNLLVAFKNAEFEEYKSTCNKKFEEAAMAHNDILENNPEFVPFNRPGKKYIQ